MREAVLQSKQVSGSSFTISQQALVATERFYPKNTIEVQNRGQRIKTSQHGLYTCLHMALNFHMYNWRPTSWSKFKTCMEKQLLVVSLPISPPICPLNTN